MKKTLLYIAIVSWGWLVLYLVGSFAAASFDIAVWDVFGRFMLSMVAFFVAATAMLVFDPNNNL